MCSSKSKSNLNELFLQVESKSVVQITIKEYIHLEMNVTIDKGNQAGSINEGINKSTQLPTHVLKDRLV